MATILVVDDDQDLTDLLRYALEREGFTVRTTHRGRDTVRMVREDTPDLIVLDVTMPDMDGFNVLSVLRTFSRVPVVMLTGRGHEEDIIVGFGHGADDYVAKPFNVQVLVARIKAVLRRATYQPGVSAPCGRSYRLGGAVFHPDANEIIGQDVSIKLTRTEGHILHLLLVHAGRVLSTPVGFRRLHHARK